MRTILLAGLGLAVAGLLAASGVADDHEGPEEAPPVDRVPMPIEKLELSVEFRDGDRRMKLWINPRVIVHLLGPKERATKPEPPLEGARLVATPRGARVWLLPSTAPPSPAVADLLTARRHGTFSPALHTEATSGSGLLALPGGVSLVFSTAWDDARIRDFARRHELGELTPLTVGPGWYGARTSPGLAAIERANALLATGELLAATPNFWRPSVPRRR